MNNSKNQELLELDQKIKHILFYKKSVHRNSTCSKILDLMYPDIKLTVGQIASHIDRSYIYTKKIVRQMQLDRYLLSDGKKYKRAYHLSQTGRWFAICMKLDYVQFQSLCILSQVYYRIKKDPNNKTGCYMISKFRDKLDKSYDVDQFCASAVYTSRNISQSIRMLTDRNLIYWINNDFVKISSGVFEYLQKYDQDFTSLVTWQNQIFERCTKEQLKVVLNIPEKKKLFSLAKSMV